MKEIWVQKLLPYFLDPNKSQRQMSIERIFSNSRLLMEMTEYIHVQPMESKLSIIANVLQTFVFRVVYPLRPLPLDVLRDVKTSAYIRSLQPDEEVGIWTLKLKMVNFSQTNPLSVLIIFFPRYILQVIQVSMRVTFR